MQVFSTTARVAIRQGWPALLIDDRPTLPQMYGLTDCPGGRFTWEEFPARNIRLFADQGIRLFQVMLWEEWMFCDGDDAMDLEIAKKQVRGVLEQCPDALVAFRYHLNTTHAWNEAHPDECVQYADAGYHPPIAFRRHRPVDDDEKNTLRPSLASRVWKERSGERLRRFCEAFADTGEGGRVFAIQVACGVFGEWHQWGFLRHEPDVSPAMRDFFREELRRKYHDDHALREAWSDPEATLDNVRLPSLEERWRCDDGIFRDPRKQQRVIDYYDALQAAAPEAILHFCRILRASWPRPLVTGAFHGYFKFLFGRAAVGGHNAVRRLLESPDIDYLSAPQSYNGFCRHLGGTGESRGFPGACRRAGKLWLDEMDQNSHLGSILVPPVAKTTAEDVAVMRRNMFHPHAHGQGAWYYDFGPHNLTGSWDHPELMAEVGSLHRTLSDGYGSRPFSRPADVLLVFDTRAVLHTIPDWGIDSVGQALMDELPNAWMRSGAIIEEAYLHELPKIDPTPYKLVVFANCHVLDDRQKQTIRERFARNHRHLFWNYLPGYSDGNSLSLAHTEAVTGFRLRTFLPENEPALRFAEGEMPDGIQHLGVRAPQLVFEGDSIEIDPVHGPDAPTSWIPIPFPEILSDKDTVPLGHYLHRMSAGFARKPMEGWHSWFAGLPIRHPGALRAVARSAGCHVVSDHNDAVTAGGGWLSLHTAEGGPRSLHLPDGTRQSLTLPPNSTTLLRLNRKLPITHTTNTP